MSVDVSAIQDQLQDSRRGTSGVMATTMNFIVYIDDSMHRQWVMERTIALSEKHACRALVLDATRSTSAACVATSVQEAAQSLVRAERIELPIGELSSEQVGTLAHSLSAPGVPSILWWTSETITRNDHFNGLNEIVDSLVVDSSGLNVNNDALKEFIEYFHCERRIRVRDLAYMRLLPWQDVVAQLFDYKEVIEDLFNISEVEIVSGSDAEALYLIGWLASRLEWSACKRDQLCTKHGESVRFVQKRAGDIRRIFKVTLTTPGSRFIAELSNSSADTVCLWVEGAKARESRCTPLQKVDNLSLLDKAILNPQTDDVFAASLEMANHLVRL